MVQDQKCESILIVWNAKTKPTEAERRLVEQLFEDRPEAGSIAAYHTDAHVSYFVAEADLDAVTKALGEGKVWEAAPNVKPKPQSLYQMLQFPAEQMRLQSTRVGEIADWMAAHPPRPHPDAQRLIGKMLDRKPG